MKLKIIIVVLILTGLGWIGYQRITGAGSNAVQYQTAKVERGTLVVTISASGIVSTANSAQVTTRASGVVKKIYVQNEQKIKAGDPIAELDLDMEGQQRSISAFSSYQSAKDLLFSLQSDMLTKWKTYMDIAQSGTYQNSDGSPRVDYRQLPQFVSTNDDWLSTEAKYKNQQNNITQTWLTYQLTSPIIYAPISGVVTGLGLQIGSVITAQSNSSGGSSAQKIASIKTSATPTVTFNLTEVDVVKVGLGDRVTVTMDAFAGKTFTGKVVSVDTVGSVSSNVTTYPAVIKLDTDNDQILTNMSAQANIITDSKTEVLLVPSSAVKQGVVQILKNGQIQSMNVQTGLSSTSQTEIISGLSEGDDVVTGTVATSALRTTNQAVSPFGAFGGGGGFRVR